MIGDIGRYTSELDIDGNPKVVRIPASLTLDENDFNEDGSNKFPINPGDVYQDENGIYVRLASDENGYVPSVDEEGWKKMRALRLAGANTGPGSDALSYPDMMYNPYPGTINSNCTYAV